MTPILSLPEEVLGLCLAYVDVYSLSAAARVSKLWQKVVLNFVSSKNANSYKALLINHKWQIETPSNITLKLACISSYLKCYPKVNLDFSPPRLSIKLQATLQGTLCEKGFLVGEYETTTQFYVYQGSSSRKWVIICHSEGVERVNLETKVKQSLPALADKVHAIAISHDEQKVAFGLNNGTVYLWDCTQIQKYTWIHKQASAPTGLGFSKDNKLLSSYCKQKVLVTEIS